MKTITPEQIDELLPQTQCGLCSYGGCMPYAEAITYEHAAINLCPPGGVKTLVALGELLKQDITAFIPDMEVKTKSPTLAIIREPECIGCKKCINVCPVDAILGTAKHMHTVITDECTGCELCVPACPVDCIDIIALTDNSSTLVEKSKLARKRFQSREKRILQEKNAKQLLQQDHSAITKRKYIEEAITRAKARKNK